jgi:hypothetical protein
MRVRWQGTQLSEKWAFAHFISAGKCEEKRSFERQKHRWKDNIKTDFKDTGSENVQRIHLAHDRDQYWAPVNAEIMNKGFHLLRHSTTSASESQLMFLKNILPLSSEMKQTWCKLCLLLASCCFLCGLLFNPEDRGNILLWNVHWLLMDNMASYPRRQNPTQSPLWKLIMNVDFHKWEGIPSPAECNY